MKLYIYLTAVIALMCVSVELVLADDGDPTNTTVANTTMSDSNATVSGTDWSSVSRIAKSMMCFLSCRGHSFTSPPDCVCPGRRGCGSLQCEQGKSCKILRGGFGTCVKDSSVCDQPKSTVACDQVTMTHYWNKDTSRCERFDSGQCSDNDNSFQSRRECYMTCGSKMGRGMFKGIGRRVRNRFRSRRPGRFWRNQ